jgi:hypothetical protein
LGHCQLLAVAAFAQIGGQNITLVAQRWRETFPFGVAWLAVEDQRYQRPVGMALAKQAHLVVDRPAVSRSGRSEEDPRASSVDRRNGLLAERATGVEIVPVAKDRSQLFGDRAHRRSTTDQVLVDPKLFQVAMQSLCRRAVAVAIGEERAILQGFERSHEEVAKALALRPY